MDRIVAAVLCHSVRHGRYLYRYHENSSDAKLHVFRGDDLDCHTFHHVRDIGLPCSMASDEHFHDESRVFTRTVPA